MSTNGALVLLLGSALAILDRDAANHEHVKETLVQDILSVESLRKSAVLYNVHAADNKMVLRGPEGDGSRVTFNQEHASPDWSVEFSFTLPELQDTQKATVAFWNTTEKLQPGQLIQAATKYKGVMAGIQMSKKRHEIIFKYNYGSDERDPEAGMLRDHVNPSILAGLSELTMKVVHTENNFLIELFSKGRLISDSFRISGEIFPDDEQRPTHFGITTAYHKTPRDVAIELKELKLYDREEDEDYRPGEHHVEHNTFPETESDVEIRGATSDIKHFLIYMHTALGGEDKNAIADMSKRLKDLTAKQKEQLDALRTALAAIAGRAAGKAGVSAGTGLDRINESVKELSDRIAVIGSIIKGSIEYKDKPYKEVSTMVIVFAIGGVLIMLLKRLLWKYLMFGITPKKE